MRAVQSHPRFIFRLANRNALVLIWALLAVTAGAPVAHAQGSIPVLRGVYFGNVTLTLCDGSFSSPGPSPAVRITSQVNDSFSGQIDVLLGQGGPVSFSGTVDSGGGLQGTWEWTGIDDSGSGTFTGKFDSTVVPKTLDLTFTGTLILGAGRATCDVTFSFTGTLLTASGGPSADLSISGSASPNPVATGDRIGRGGAAD